MYWLKINNKCNNNCLFCEDMRYKAKEQKSLLQVRQEIDQIKEKEVFLPCSSDTSRDFIEILNYLKAKGKNILLQTNARMFKYKRFASETIKYADEIVPFVLSMDKDVHERYTQVPDSLSQAIEGIENIPGKKLKVFVDDSNIGSLKKIIVKFEEYDITVYPLILNPVFLKKAKDILGDKASLVVVPQELKIEVTPRCNLECDFCYNSNSFHRDSEELSLKELYSFIDMAADSGVRNIRISGGEPLLRKDLFEILRYAKKKDLKIILNTNATLLKLADASRFKGLVDYFLLPLHDLEKKNLDRLSMIVKELLNQELNVQLTTIMTRDNIKNLESYVKVVLALKVKWFLLRPIPTKKNRNIIDNEDVKQLIEKLLDIKDKFGVVTIDSIPFCAYEPEKVKIFSQGSMNCGIYNKIVLGPEGNFKPCYSISKPLGNDLKKAWNDLPKRFRDLEFLPKECSNCRYLESCLGGCRFAAKLVNGRYDALDPLAMPKKYI